MGRGACPGLKPSTPDLKSPSQALEELEDAGRGGSDNGDGATTATIDSDEAMEMGDLIHEQPRDVIQARPEVWGSGLGP
jgi:hypothetical protein